MTRVGYRSVTLLLAALLATGRAVTALDVPTYGADARERPAEWSAPSRDSLSRLTDRAAKRSPFRIVAALEEEPAVPIVEVPEEPLQPVITMPEIRVKAIVGGPPWSAVLAGIPGTVGEAVVHPGDRIAELTVVTLTADTAVLRWNDSTWTIRLERSGP